MGQTDGGTDDDIDGRTDVEIDDGTERRSDRR